MTLVIRDATPEDAPPWWTLREAIAGEPEITALAEPGEGSTVEELARRIAEAIPGAVWHLVAVDDGRVVGTLGMKRGERRAARHVADLGIGVAREHRGRGVGRALMLAAEERARAAGVTKLTLGVFVGNERAQRLYRSLGYHEEGLRRGHYVVRGVAIDELLMAKHLP